MRKTSNPPPLSIAVQLAGLRMSYPQGITSWGRNWVICRGSLSPGLYSRSYELEVSYQIRDSPTVCVIQPDLKELSGGRPLPHVYDQARQELCLHLPGVGLWSSNKSIASTVMRWAGLWLYY